RKVDVTAVYRHRQAVVHSLSAAIPEKSRIIGHIDYVRRRRLMVHHSATHLLLGVLREVLGDHVWQSGVQKGTERSRLDITHFKRLTLEEIREVERRCLLYITENRPIKVRNIEWNRALSTYGFRLFEGGVPDGNKIRVVEIEGVDAEGCGGTHLHSTGEIGFLKILRVETLQEGIQRIIFSAGDAALEFVQGIYESELYLETMLSVKSEDLSSSVQRLFQENLALKKEKERRIKEDVDRIILEGSAVSYRTNKVLITKPISDPEILKALVAALFSRKIGTAVVPYRNANTMEVRIISDGGDDARLLTEAMAANLSAKITGSGRHITLTEISAFPDEKLISRILDGKHS
ncbi:MAG: alanine--tRNA ligase, partial [Thermoplasmataceae archaeon]